MATIHMPPLDETLKTVVDKETAEKFRRSANEIDMLPAELLRDLIFLHLDQVTYLETVANHRRGLLLNQVRELGLNASVRGA